MYGIIIKTLKYSGIVLASIAGILLITYFILDTELPEGKSGKAADVLARNILNTLNDQKYQETNFIEWTFREKNQYKWNKTDNTVHAKIGEDSVFLDLKNQTNNKVLLQNSSNTPQNIIEKAIKNFNNDSFWVVAPFKLFDSGTKRSIVNFDDGSRGLLITYTSGGSTPGDSYLWKLDQYFRPVSYQMWVSIIPIGGLEVTWENWTKMQSGIYLAKTHKILGILDIPISNLRAYNID